MPRANRGAELWQAPNGVWYIRIYKDGRRVLRSTGERDRRLAQAELGRVLVAADRPALPPSPTLADVLTAYAAARTETHGYRQLESKCRNVAKAIGWLRPEEVKGAQVRSYIKRRRADGLKDGTIREELAKMRAAIRWAYGEGLVHSLPTITIPLDEPVRTRALTAEEADCLVAAAVSPHIRTFLLLALNTGARLGAILELEWSRVDLPRRVIDYGVRERGKARARVPINDTLLSELLEAQARKTTRWVVEWNGDRVRNIDRGFRNTLRRAGIEHCTRHDLRRTAGSMMIQAGVPLEVVASVLGHRNINTTRRVYAHLMVDHLRGAVAALDRRG